MSEWWTYELSDLLLFSPRVWERLLASYGAAVWPAQVAFALAGLVLLTRRGPRSRRLTLGAAWAFSGMVFHLQHYATINPYARWIGLMFVLQAIVLLAAGRGPDSAVHPVRAAAGRLLCAAAVLGWPFMAPALARPWAAAEVFGTHPDPTAVATLGSLLLWNRRIWPLAVFPLFACAISGATLYELGRREALAPLMAAGVFVVTVIGARGPRPER